MHEWCATPGAEKRMKNFVQLLIGLALFVVLVGVILYGHYHHRFYKQTLDIDHEVTLNIEPGANFTPVSYTHLTLPTKRIV